MATESVIDNLQQQVDEIEALASIYGEDWCCVDARSRCYCIGVDERNLGEDEEPARWRVKLQILMTDEYPGQGPPIYQIKENAGECIIYLWVEEIRQFLQEKSAKEPPLKDAKRTEEIDDIEDEEEEEFSETEGEDSEVPDSAESISSISAPDAPCPEIHHGETLTDRRSTFQPHLSSVNDRHQVKRVLDRLYQNKKIANATHNIYAYRIRLEGGTIVSGCDDDGETHAGSRMLHLLKITDVENVLVIVSRWYGGIQLGPDRFKHINNCTRNILVQHDFITTKESVKTSSRKHHKGKS